jgi:tRNA (guanine10-N2)-dimethyltransferase
MTDKILCILGRQPAIGIAELESLFGPETIVPFDNYGAVLSCPLSKEDILRIGGTIKFCKIIAVLSIGRNWGTTEQSFINKITDYIPQNSDGKLKIGFSLYGLTVNLTKLNSFGLSVKKLLKQKNQSARIIPNTELQLSSAQIIYNKLCDPRGHEIVFASDGRKIIIAKTIAVQDINSYTFRDRSRPKRDSRVGMLPPKLAQIIVNLSSPSLGNIILDPFCGTGVILQEASLMGLSPYGTDVEQRMIEYSNENLLWFKDNFNKPTDWLLEQADATNHRWKSFNNVASEVYLGPPLTSLPSHVVLEKFSNICNTIIEKFLYNLKNQTPPGTRICLAVPAWQLVNNQFKHLPMLDHLETLGYNRLSFVHAKLADLIYYRPNQIVGRELIVMTRK